jgi:uncharacterized membrane protein
MKALVNTFLRGVVFLAPIAVTAAVCFWIFRKIDAPLQRYMGDVPGLGFGVAVLGSMVLCLLVGLLASNFITGALLGLVDKVFTRFPLVKLLYASVKDLTGAFVGEDRKFDKPVKVELVPGSDVGVVGFVTRDDMAAWGLRDQVAVYLPQSYNFAGNLIVLPRGRCTPLAVPSGDVMAFIVSGGVTRQAADGLTRRPGERGPQAEDVQ